MITRPAFKNKSVRDVIQSAVRVVEILGNSDLRNMIHGILELDADIKRFDASAWLHFDQAQREVLVDIGNGVETLKDANARLDREEAARFRPIGISSTREELPALALIDEALTGIGATAKQLGHGLPPRELYLSFLALDLPHHADWSLVMAQAALDNLGLVGSILIFCVGVNLIWPRTFKPANMLPAVFIAAAWAFVM